MNLIHYHNELNFTEYFFVLFLEIRFSSYHKGCSEFLKPYLKVGFKTIAKRKLIYIYIYISR